MYMQLLVIRHAIAEEREDFGKTGQPDDLRPLLADGTRKMARAAPALTVLAPAIDVLASSPLVRAMQTAQIVAAEYQRLGIVQTDELRPDVDPPVTARWLASQANKELVAIVGHEPHLGLFVSWLLAGTDDSRIELKKGAACLLRLDEKPGKRAATLVWALTPWQLRRIADRTA